MQSAQKLREDLLLVQQNLRQGLDRRHYFMVKRDEVFRSIQFSPMKEGVEKERGAIRRLRFQRVEATEYVDVDLLHSLGEGLKDEAAAAGGGVEGLHRQGLGVRH